MGLARAEWGLTRNSQTKLEFLLLKTFDKENNSSCNLLIRGIYTSEKLKFHQVTNGNWAKCLRLVSEHSYLKSIWPSIFPGVTFPIDFLILVCNYRLYNGKGSLHGDVMLTGSQTVLNALRDVVRRFFNHDRIWKELVMDAWIIDCTGNTTWQPQLVDDNLQMKEKKL